jgi:hypothetical protein
MRTSISILATAGVLLLAACGADAGAHSTTSEAARTTIDGGAATTVDPAADGAAPAADTTGGANGVTEQIEPAGEVSGGTVGRSYAAADYPAAMEDFITAAKGELASSLGIEVGAVDVAFVEEVTWSDASLGCPRPGMRYTQVPVDGMRIALAAGGVLYDYRTDGLRTPLPCVPTPVVPTPVTEKGTPLLEIREDGSVVTIAPPPPKDGLPTETITPGD